MRCGDLIALSSEAIRNLRVLPGNQETEAALRPAFNLNIYGQVDYSRRFQLG